MAENNQKNNDSASPVLSHAASAAGMAKSALKTGKAIAGMSKGAAAGPYGMIAAGLWENRKMIGKILGAVGCVILIPVLYIMMLPSLIFGNDGMDNADGDVLNDTDLIMENIAETETSIETSRYATIWVTCPILSRLDKTLAPKLLLTCKRLPDTSYSLPTQ